MELDQRTFDKIVQAVYERTKIQAQEESTRSLFAIWVVFVVAVLGCMIVGISCTAIGPDGSRAIDRPISKRSTMQLAELMKGIRKEMAKRELDLEVALAKMLESGRTNTPAGSEADGEAATQVEQDQLLRGSQT